MASSSLVDQFIELFDGNRHAVGTEEGGSVKVTMGDDEWHGRMSNHLHKGGDHALGVYPLVARMGASGSPTEWEVKWGCVDFDEGEAQSWQHAVRLQALLDKFDVTAWIERSRSKGYHVWVFMNTWTPAWVVRRALLVATAAVGAPTKEINPKTEWFADPETLGNYVRLPYPGWLDGSDLMPTHRCVLDVTPQRDAVWDAEDFVASALENRTDPADMMLLASKWQPPTPVVQRDVQDITDDQLTDAISRVGKRTIHLLLDGPIEGRDRSSTLFWVGQQLVRDGKHSYDECVALLKHADLRWGQKYVGRPDAERRYTDIINKAWSEL